MIASHESTSPCSGFGAPLPLLLQGSYISLAKPNYLAWPSAWESLRRRPTGGLRLRIVIWLILPVVICLSQRLSHACVSISDIRRDCEWLIKTVIVYLVIKITWITVVILELIHAVVPDSRRAVFIRYQPISVSYCGDS